MSLQKKLNGKRPIGAYFQSWSSSWSGNAESLDLAKLSDSVNIVFLSFANPNCTYTKGSNTFSGTGLDFSSDFNVVMDAIKILQNKKVVVMLSVGGATYAFNDSFDANNIVNFADDLGVDGIDIDWEPSGGASQSYQFGQIIQKIRNIYPNKLLSSAVFSVGAYGQGAFANSQPASANTGMCISGLQSDGSKLDFLNLMSYDASNAYNPIEAFKAYKTYFNGPILIGTEVPPEAWGGHVLTLDEVKTFANYVKSNGNCDGLFVWSYQKTGSPPSQDILSTAKNIFQPSPVSINSFSTPDVAGAGGTVWANSAGGSAPYTYQWNDPNNTINDSVYHVPAGTYIVTVTDAHGCIAHDTVVVQFISSVDNSNFSSLINIFPNPTRNKISISSEIPLNAEIQLTDVLGRIVFAENLKNEMNKDIDISFLLAGDYMLSITTDKNSLLKKIIKN